MGQVHLVIEELQSLSRLFVQEVVETTGRAKQRQTKARIALSGGSVAASFLPALVSAQLELETIEVFWCDERAVPLSDARSNFRSASELWLGPAGLSDNQLYPMSADPQLEEAARAYELELRKRGETPLDLVLLGVGPDGHIASLFPGQEQLDSQRWIEVVRAAPKPPPERLTMTLELLARAPRIVVAAFGQEKAPVIAQALEPTCRLPISRLLERAPRVELWLDPEAASALGPRWHKNGFYAF